MSRIRRPRRPLRAHAYVVNRLRPSQDRRDRHVTMLLIEAMIEKAPISRVRWFKGVIEQAIHQVAAQEKGDTA